MTLKKVCIVAGELILKVPFLSKRGANKRNCEIRVFVLGDTKGVLHRGPWRHFAKLIAEKKSDETGDEFHKEPKECTLLSAEDVFENVYLAVKVRLSSGEFLTGEAVQSPEFQ